MLYSKVLRKQMGKDQYSPQLRVCYRCAGRYSHTCFIQNLATKDLIILLFNSCCTCFYFQIISEINRGSLDSTENTVELRQCIP